MRRKRGRLDGHGVPLAYLCWGEGPLVLLLHGFPQDAYVWEPCARLLARAGYCAVALFQRGHPPSGLPTAPYYDLASLAADARAALDQLTSGQPAVLIGNDWGGWVTYAVATVYPDRVAAAVTLGTLHPREFEAEVFAGYDQVRAAWHLGFFQLEGVAEEVIARERFAFLDRFWADWCPRLLTVPGAAERLKTAFSRPGVLAAALGYYRALFDARYRDPALAPVYEALWAEPVRAPLLQLYGRDDPRAAVPSGPELYAAGYRRLVLPLGGHCLQLDCPDEVVDAFLAWRSGARLDR